MQVSKTEKQKKEPPMFFENIGGSRVYGTRMESSFSFVFFDPNKDSCVQ